MDEGRSSVRVLDVSKNRSREVKYEGNPKSTEVRVLMQVIEKEFAIPIKRQRLICSGRLLRPEDVIGQAKTIHLFPRSEDAPLSTHRQRNLTEARLERRVIEEHELARLALFDQPDLEQQQQESYDELGTPREFFWGFIMGILLGFIMLLYLWERSISHRQKMGILAGATVQLFFKYLHSGLQATQAGP